uniref:Intracellular protein transport protein USO1 n=1 Tax=Rhizophora mucronata TaxID=61149 RepID=A0A2P2MX71_RHIMU
MEKREAQAQSCVQVAVPCNSGGGFECWYIGTFRGSQGCGEANSEIREGFGPGWKLLLGISCL